MAEYIAVIHKEKDTEYGISFPDFPGCITAGKNLEEARKLATEALQGHIDVCREYGDPIPEPSTLEEIKAMQDNLEAEAYLVVNVPTMKPQKVRVNIILTKEDLHLIDMMAKKRRVSRSAFMAEAATKEAILPG